MHGAKPNICIAITSQKESPRIVLCFVCLGRKIEEYEPDYQSLRKRPCRMMGNEETRKKSLTPYQYYTCDQLVRFKLDVEELVPLDPLLQHV